MFSFEEFEKSKRLSLPLRNRFYCSLIALVSLLMVGCDSKTEDTGEAHSFADLILTNGFVYTVDSNKSVAQAVAVRNSQIVFVGSNEQAQAFIGPQTTHLDLAGRMVLPGLHDMHIHALGTVEPDMCDFRGEPKSFDEMVPFLKNCIDQYEIPNGEWLIVLQWPFSRGNQPSEALPTIRAALDAASRDHPIILWGDDGHHAAVNSLALSLAKTRQGQVVGISAQTIEDVFSDYREMIAVDKEGKPTGGLNEGARLLVRPSMIEDFLGLAASPESIMPRVAQQLAAAGITSIQDPYVVPRTLELYDWLEKSGGMTFRMRAGLFQHALDSHSESAQRQIRDHVSAFDNLRKRYDSNPHMQVNGIKLFADAVLEGNPRAHPPTLPVAAVLNGFKQPIFAQNETTGAPELTGYVDLDSEICVKTRAGLMNELDAEQTRQFEAEHGFLPSQCKKSSGVLEHGEAFIEEYVRQMTEAGFHVHIHALSDRGVRAATNAFAATKTRADQLGVTQSLAHVQLAHPDDQQRLGELGVTVVFTYVWIFPGLEYDTMVIPFIDEVGEGGLYDPDSYYMRNVYPVKSLKNHGVIPVFGSDVPVGSRNPMPFVSMLAGLTREADGVVMNASQKLNIHELIAAYTIDGARLMGHDQEVGSIEVGKVADLIVVDRNLIDIANSENPEAIAGTQVDLTLFEGRVIYERQADPAAITVPN